MLHYKACAHTRKQKIADIALLVFGVVASVYTTVQVRTSMLNVGVIVNPWSAFAFVDGPRECLYVWTLSCLVEADWLCPLVFAAHVFSRIRQSSIWKMRGTSIALTQKSPSRYLLSLGLDTVHVFPCGMYI
jgi:hypothetical protein